MGGFPGEKNRSLIFVELRNIPANKAGVEMGAGVGAGAAAAAPPAGAFAGVGAEATAATGAGAFAGAVAGAGAVAAAGLGLMPAGTGALLEDDMAASNVVDLNCRRGKAKLVGGAKQSGYRGHV